MMATMTNKKPFRFYYTVPSLDWYGVEKVEIEWEEYLYFKIQYRFGQTYWLMGYKEKDGRMKREEVEIGRLSRGFLGEFVKWCEFNDGYRTCSKLIGISVISTGMNILDVFGEIQKAAKSAEANDV